MIASVALDPGAVGFVSLTDLKPHENRVKILGIVFKEGDGFPETIRSRGPNAAGAGLVVAAGSALATPRRTAPGGGSHGPTEDYPLQQRWSLQLHAPPEPVRWKLW